VCSSDTDQNRFVRRMDIQVKILRKFLNIVKIEANNRNRY
jgi:hypothetical protein